MVSSYIQSALIGILNPVYSITGKINKRVRNLIIQVLYVVIFGMYIAFRAKVFKHAFYRELLHDVSWRYAFCTLLLMIIAIMTIDAPLNKVKWRPAIIYTQLITGLGIIIISFLHPIGAGYRLFGFQLLFVFPCFYFIWNNRGDYQNLIKPVLYAVTIIGAFFYAGTYMMAFKGRLMIHPGSTRMAGVMPNSNSFSLIGMQLVLCALYLLVTEGGRWSVTCCTGAAFGMGLGIINEGQMRIAILTVSLCIIFTLYYSIRFLRSHASKKMIPHLLVLILIAGSMIQITSMLPIINQHAIDKKAGIAESVVSTEEPVESEKPDVVDRIMKTEEEDLNNYSSGRIQIWQNYASELNLLGNNFDEYDPMNFTGKKNLPYAHNIFLEIAYRCGIPVGVMAVLYYFICGIVCVSFLFSSKSKKPSYLLFPIISAITFALESLLDCAVLPFFQAEALLFYIAVAVMIDKNVTSNSDRN